MKIEKILWKSYFMPGHEICQLSQRNSRWKLDGILLFAHEQQPDRLDYQVVCDSRWQTISAKVQGMLGNMAVDLQLAVNESRHWSLNQLDCPQVAGCIDLDLNFSPSTNLLPIRRLGLKVGESAQITAAWLRFPAFKLEPLEQQYTRLAENTYRYESHGGEFVAELQVTAEGFVTNYPDLWQAEAYCTE